MATVKINSTINNTLEEELRVMLIDKNTEVNRLRNEILTLKNIIKEEQEGRYAAYSRISELLKELDKVKNQLQVDIAE